MPADLGPDPFADALLPDDFAAPPGDPAPPPSRCPRR